MYMDNIPSAPLYNIVFKRPHEYIVSKDNEILQDEKDDEFCYTVINSTAATRKNIKYTNVRL